MLVDNTTFAGGNFWYQAYAVGQHSPVASGNPIVTATAQVRTSGATVVPLSDIPFAGMHFEGYTSAGTQQSLTPIFVNVNGGITVFTNTVTTATNAVTTADGLIPREQWRQVTARFDFQAQTFQVFLNGSSTPVLFTRDGDNNNLGTPITNVPFRNTFGDTVSIAEIGMVGFYGRDPFAPGGTFQPQNDFFVDDYTVVMSPNPVPEPGWLVAVGFAGVAVNRWRRRRRAG
jgi:hypothetical protein